MPYHLQSNLFAIEYHQAAPSSTKGRKIVYSSLKRKNERRRRERQRERGRDRGGWVGREREMERGRVKGRA